MQQHAVLPHIPMCFELSGGNKVTSRTTETHIHKQTKTVMVISNLSGMTFMFQGYKDVKFL